MADILTHLRELSVGFVFASKKSIKDIDPEYFLKICRENIKNCENLDIAQISKDMTCFGKTELNTVNNGLQLGNAIRKYFKISEKPSINWLGGCTQSGTVVDLIIDQYRFSLKEDSHILENMGLYKLLNTLTGEEKFSRGLHCFEHFSKISLNNWFSTTKEIIISELKKKAFIIKKEYMSRAFLEDGNLHLEFYRNNCLSDSSILENFKDTTYDDFLGKTNDIIREKIFAKLINERVSRDEKYIRAKSDCAKEAGKAIIRYLSGHIGKSPVTLARFFRFENDEYYYAKTTDKFIEIFKVPSLNTFKKNISIKDIQYSVPSSQLNIITTIQNKTSKQEIEFRNELRYSHGQFNGTPEAKLYIKEGSLDILCVKEYEEKK